MIQSIEILLLPQMALEERIMQEVESNPALEISDERDEDDSAPAAEAPATAAEQETERRVSAEDLARGNDQDHEQYSEWLKSRQATSDENSPDKMEAIEATAGPTQNLAEYLMDQVRFAEISPEGMHAAEVLVHALDRRGYLCAPLTELFPDEEMEAAEEAWEVIRKCEPAGIGALNVRDCLLLQLQREHGDNSFEIALVRDHLDDVLRNRLPSVAQAMQVPVERVQEGIEAIQRLDPNPGLPFAKGENHFVVPDVRAERSEDGKWTVTVLDSNLPKVEVSKDYQKLLGSGSIDDREKTYLKEKLSSARWLIDAVAQRKRTLLKISIEIIKAQQAFLEFGPEHLRPLMRQDIADKIKMHVATVSRAVKDKYVETPAGILPLSAFFSGGIATQDGTDAESSSVVKLRIHKLVEAEDARHPLSDQHIADLLAKEGLDISRRTVTKYRIAENIPSTRQRREFATRKG
jgi:RNA polymerase sigma-54 factor